MRQTLISAHFPLKTLREVPLESAQTPENLQKPQKRGRKPLKSSNFFVKFVKTAFFRTSCEKTQGFGL